MHQRKVPEEFVYKRPDYPEKRTALKSIRYFCIDCCLGQYQTIENCPDEGCALWPYRLGKDPRLKGRRNAGSFKAGTANPMSKPSEQKPDRYGEGRSG